MPPSAKRAVHPAAYPVRLTSRARLINARIASLSASVSRVGVRPEHDHVAARTRTGTLSDRKRSILVLPTTQFPKTRLLYCHRPTPAKIGECVPHIVQGHPHYAVSGRHA